MKSVIVPAFTLVLLVTQNYAIPLPWSSWVNRFQRIPEDEIEVAIRQASPEPEPVVPKLPTGRVTIVGSKDGKLITDTGASIPMKLTAKVVEETVSKPKFLKEIPQAAPMQIVNVKPLIKKNSKPTVVNNKVLLDFGVLKASSVGGKEVKMRIGDKYVTLNVEDFMNFLKKMNPREAEEIDGIIQSANGNLPVVIEGESPMKSSSDAFKIPEIPKPKIPGLENRMNPPMPELDLAKDDKIDIGKFFPKINELRDRMEPASINLGSVIPKHVQNNGDRNRTTPSRLPRPEFTRQPQWPKPGKPEYSQPSHPSQQPNQLSPLLKLIECFPASATVLLKDGRTLRMDQLQEGMHVLSNGNGEFSQIFGFSHRDPNARSKFVRFRTANGNELSLTPGHFLRINGELEPASNLRPGDSVTLDDGICSAVVYVDTIWDDGLYNPHTLEGSIVVNGVVASTFTTAVEPSAARALLSPVAAVFRTVGYNVMGALLDGPRIAVRLLVSHFLGW